MPSRKNTLIIHVIWGLGGLTLGACIALLVSKNWAPDWIGATGTWFGAVATVLTLLWAVRSFRSDQAERENSRLAERDKEVAALMERESGDFKEASHVSIALMGGAGEGTPPDMVMTSLHVKIRNHSKYDAVVKAVTLDGELTPRGPLPEDVHIPAGETFTRIIQIVSVPGHPDELSGRPMTRFIAGLSYRLNGRDWRRNSQSEPVPV